MRPLITATLALTVLACDAVPSADLETRRIRADYTLVAHDRDAVEIEATLQLDGTALTFVDLAPQDHLIADDGIHIAPVDTVTNVLDAITYRTTAPLRPGPVQVRLQRRDWPSANESWVVMPRPFHLSLGHRDYVWGLDDVPLFWSAGSRADVEVEVEGRCLRDESWRTRDEGFFLITPDMLAVRPSWDGDRCVVDVTVSRVFQGDLDPGLAGGHITARQTRTARFDLYR